MEKLRKLFSGGIRMKIFSMLLITILLIIAAYTAILFYQSNKVEQLVEDSYELQQQLFAESGLEDHSERVWNESVEVFRRGMFHARNILILLVALIVVTGLASAFSISSQITDPLNMITKRVASLGVSNRRFEMEDAYRTGDEIEVLAESFAKQSARTELYIDQIKRVTAEKERIGTELEMASRIQSSQLPRLFPPFPERKEFSLFASMTPAKEVGGDFYDFFMIDDDHIAFVIADVSGKGVPASLVMMVSRVLIKSSLQNGKNPAEAPPRPCGM